MWSRHSDDIMVNTNKVTFSMGAQLQTESSLCMCGVCVVNYSVGQLLHQPNTGQGHL